MKHNDESFKLDGVIGRIRSENGYLYGDVITPYGVVAAVCDTRTRLDFVCKGRHHMRTWNRRFTARGLATKANEFARELTYAPPTP